ncbi:MAG: hypothetical protein GDA54_04720 [Alphaproteobacteria bacterium GM7ARS4]|nr:hypothetical protein [Alphaproteobacteria bacterium GM7ARS4]
MMFVRVQLPAPSSHMSSCLCHDQNFAYSIGRVVSTYLSVSFFVVLMDSIPWRSAAITGLAFSVLRK